MTQLVWPNGSSTTEPIRSDDWGWRTGFSRPFHTGQDWHSIGSLKAIGAGTVVENHWGGWAGNQVLLHLGVIDGLETWARYCHLASQPALGLGTTLALGATVGQEGDTGESIGAHLHLEIYRGTPDRGNGNGPASTVNPRTFIAAHLSGSNPQPIEKEEEDMPDSMFAVVDGVPSWCILNWGTGKLHAVHTQAEANWLGAYMGNTKFNLAQAIYNGQQVTDGGSALYKSKLALFGSLAPDPQIANASSLTTEEVSRIQGFLEAGGSDTAPAASLA